MCAGGRGGECRQRVGCAFAGIFISSEAAKCAAGAGRSGSRAAASVCFAGLKMPRSIGVNRVIDEPGDCRGLAAHYFCAMF